MKKMIFGGFFIVQTVSVNISYANNPVSIEYVNQKVTEFLALINNTSGPAGPAGPPGAAGATGPAGQGAGTFTVGQQVFGGVVFWLDSTNQHGLIVSSEDMPVFFPPIPMVWSVDTTTETFALNQWVGGGEINTFLGQVKQGSYDNSALNFCVKFEVHADGVTPCWGPGQLPSVPPTGDYCYSDWYLPSIGELQLLQTAVQNSPPGSFGTISAGPYWSSSEAYEPPAGEQAYARNLTPGLILYLLKTVTNNVRCIRSF